MFEYEWDNSYAGNLPVTDEDPTHIPPENPFSGDLPTFLPSSSSFFPSYDNYQTVLDPRAFPSASFPLAPQTAPFSTDYSFFFPKPEPGPVHQTGSDRIGLNLGLGGRTYFSAADEDFLSRLYRRSRFDGGGVAPNAPKCQAEGCSSDLSNAKHYHRRHKVCEFHSKAASVVAGGFTQRFCQQCSRFHMLTEFDNGKRSCRRRLADHNRRRRKSHQQERRSSQLEKAGNSSGSENPPRSPSESSRAHSVSSLTENKVNCYNSEASPSVSSSSIFY